MIRVLHFAGCINKHDFVDVVVQHANRRRFELGVCVGGSQSNIAAPIYSGQVAQWSIGPWRARRGLLPTAARLAGILKQWKADILHTHHFDEAVIGYIATRLYSQTKLIIGRHYSDSLYRLTSRIKRIGLMRLEQVANHGASRIIVPSTFIADLLSARQGIKREKVHVVPYGFSADKYPTLSAAEVSERRRELDIDEHFSVGIFGRIDGQKGHDVLFKAVAKLKPHHSNLRVVVVGDGPERQSIETLASSLGIQDVVRFLGWRRDALAVMTSVDAVVQPTLQEAFSQVMVEAMWLGKPLIITEVSGAIDIIEDGQNGILIPTNSVDAIEVAIHRLMKNDDLGKQLGSAAQAYVQETLKIEKVIPRYESVYEAAHVCTLGRGVQRTIGDEPVRFPIRWARYYPADYEPETFEFLKSHCHDGDTVLDIGAHLGLFTVIMARLVGPDGRVFSFEPTPSTRHVLTDVVILNRCQGNVEVRSEAVAEKSGTSVFHETGDIISNANSLVRTGRSRSSRTVATVSVDDFAISRNLKIACMKIDAEGAELEVLRGAARTFHLNRPTASLALHPNAIVERGNSLGDIWNVLAAYRMKVAKCGHSVVRDWFCEQTRLFDVQLYPI